VLSVLVKEHPRRLSNGIYTYIYTYTSHAYMYVYTGVQIARILESLLESRSRSRKVPFDSGYTGVPSVVRSREQQWDVLLYRAKRRNFSLNIVITFTRVSRRPLPPLRRPAPPPPVPLTPPLHLPLFAILISLPRLAKLSGRFLEGSRE